jgi:hypothetical protein
VIIDRFNDYMCGPIIVQRRQKSILCLKINGMKAGLFVKENLKNLIHSKGFIYPDVKLTIWQRNHPPILSVNLLVI